MEKESPETKNEEEIILRHGTKISPDVDGCRAWLVTSVGFLIFLFSGGVCYTGGIIIPELLVSFPTDEASASLVISMTTGMMNLAALLSGCFCEVFGWQKVCIAGGLMTSLGLLSSAFVRSIECLYFTYGTLVGLGLGFQFLPCVIIVQRYFTKHHALATSILFSGSSLGVFSFAIIIRHLIDTFAWRGALMVMSGIILNGVPFALLLVPPPLSKVISSRAEFEENLSGGIVSHTSKMATNVKTLFKSLKKVVLTLLQSIKDLAQPKFGLTVLAQFLKALEFGVPYVMLPMKLLTLEYSKWQVATLVAIMGAGDFVGRLLVGVQSTICNFNKILFFASSLLFCALTEVLVGFISNYYGLCVCAFCLAVYSGIFISSLAPVIRDLVGVKAVPRSYGLVCSVHGIAGFIGLPLQAIIYEVTDNINIPFYIIGSFPALASVIMIAVYLLDRTSVDRK